MDKHSEVCRLMLEAIEAMMEAIMGLGDEITNDERI